MRLLIVEDDEDVRTSLERSLRFEGFDVSAIGDGRLALGNLMDGGYRLVILDLGLPGLDGLEVCRRLRAAGDTTPVLILTARDTTNDLVTGFNVGADDYLAKPFALEELVVRIRALIRRTAPAAAEQGADLRFGDLRLDPQTYEVHRNDRLISLTRTEYRLLEMLLRYPRQVLTRDALLREVWEVDFDPGSNILEVYIGYLRKKLEAGGEPRLVHNIRGVGYSLREASRP